MGVVYLHLSQPGACSCPGCLCTPLTPWPGSKSTPEKLVSRLQAVDTTHGSEPAEMGSSGPSLLVEACWRGDPGNLPQVLSPEMFAGSARGLGCREHLDSLHWKAVDPPVSRVWTHPD